MKTGYYGFIYITTNMINGKKYIGQKSFYKDGKLRYDIHTYLGSGVIIGKAFKKYGKENFIREIIYIAKTKEELDEAEKSIIRNHNACYSNDYYNVHEGGSGGNTIAGFSKEENEVFRQKVSDRYKDEEYMLKFKDAIKDSWTDERRESASIRTKYSFIENPNLSKIRTENNIRTWQDPEIRQRRIAGMSKRIVQLDLEGNFINEFLNSNVAAIHLGIKDGSAIRSCCRGERKRYKGYIWLYKEEYENIQSA